MKNGVKAAFDPIFVKPVKIEKSVFKRYSAKALDAVKKALKTENIDKFGVKTISPKRLLEEIEWEH